MPLCLDAVPDDRVEAPTGSLRWSPFVWALGTLGLVLRCIDRYKVTEITKIVRVSNPSGLGPRPCARHPRVVERNRVIDLEGVRDGRDDTRPRIDPPPAHHRAAARTRKAHRRARCADE